MSEQMFAIFCSAISNRIVLIFFFLFSKSVHFCCLSLLRHRTKPGHLDFWMTNRLHWDLNHIANTRWKQQPIASKWSVVRLSNSNPKRSRFSVVIRLTTKPLIVNLNFNATKGSGLMKGKGKGNEVAFIVYKINLFYHNFH